MGFFSAAAASKRPPLALWGICAAAVLAVGIAAAYRNGLPGPFLYDDISSIPGNPTLRSWSAAAHPPAEATVGGRPLLNLSFAANYRLGGLVPWGYHAANVAIHILAALVLFDLVRRTLAAHFPGSASGLTAFAASALWALHPLQTESVTYIVQRAESLMGLFYLLALYGLARSLASGRPRAWLALSALCSAAGMGVKEAMVTAPVMVLLYDRTFGAGSFAECWKRRRGYYLALASGWVLLAALVVGNSGRGGTAGFGSGVAWWAYGLSQLRAVGIYLRLAVWPGPLVADYGRILGGPTLEVAGGAAAVLVLAGATGYLLYRSPPLGFLGAWFFVVLAPSSTFVPVATEIIAEHRMYLPLAAIAVGAACLASAALGRAGLAACLAAAVSLGAATAERNRVYLSNRAFWSDVAAKAPENAGGHNNLGNVLFEEGRYPEAIAEYGRALDLAPDYADAHTNLGNALARLGRYAEAVGHYETALKFRTADRPRARVTTPETPKPRSSARS